MTISLKGKNAIVTGAAAGIGTAYARALAAEGVNVAVCDVKPEIMDLAEELRVMGVQAKGWIANTSVPEDVRTVVDGAVDAFGGVDILISNAGTLEYCQADDPLDKTLIDYDSMVGTNLKGLFLFGRAVMPVMIAQGGGEIVNVATDHMVTCGSPNDICPKLPTCPWADEPRIMGADYADLCESSKWSETASSTGPSHFSASRSGVRNWRAVLEAYWTRRPSGRPDQSTRSRCYRFG
jgi:NAD(P)-dependent dehydrogenase (short-subunit alcohol dehydrogenase family)